MTIIELIGAARKAARAIPDNDATVARNDRDSQPGVSAIVVAAAPRRRRSLGDKVTLTAPAALAVLAVAAWTGAALLVRQAPLVRTPSSATRDPPALRAARAVPRVEPAELLPIEPATAREINAMREFDRTVLAKARPLVLATTSPSYARALDCLAAAQYYEAGDDTEGQRVVAQTVLNRVRHPVFPATICGVVFEGATRTTGCQFTFTCDGSLARDPSPAAWARARAAAAAALSGTVVARVGLATHYHTDYVVPYWAASLDKVATVGSHIFYQWKGFPGTPGAFLPRPARAEPIVPALAALSSAHRPPNDQLVGTNSIMAPNPAVGQLTALPPVLLPPGVSTEALRGGLVHGIDGNGTTTLMSVDPADFPGNYAIAALALCRDKPLCQVLAWRDPAQVPQALPLTETARKTLSFLYVRDLGRGAEGSFWNCRVMPRLTATQCLPSETKIDQLLVLR